ncbi:MAG: glutamyl-tRNA reductase [Thermoanaerobaculia bacterium]
MSSAERPPAPPPGLLLVGMDYRTAPLELRERVAYGEEEAAAALVHLLAREEIQEALLLSTCNRTEVYLGPRTPGATEAALEIVFQARSSQAVAPGRLFVRSGREAAEHLFRVASGLESQVLGEPEILGQVRQAAALAERVGAAGRVIGQLVRAAGAAGKRARAETAIGEGAISYGYAVVELARNIFERLEDLQIFLLGAGEMSVSVATALTERGACRLAVANRGSERLAELLGRFPAAHALSFAERLEHAAEADIVVAATGAQELLFTRQQLNDSMRRRRGRPLLVVDLGVPRNIDPEAREVENLFLHDLDSLEGLIQKNLRRRREEAARVEEIVALELDRFERWWRGLEAEPVVAQLQRQAERVRQQELAAVLERFPPELHAELEQLTRSLVRKILHHPSAQLRARAEGDRSSELDLVRTLFRLDEE